MLVLGLAFAGRPDRIAAGVRIAGVDVSGLTTGEALARLESRARAVANVPVVFRAEGHDWRVRPVNLRIEPDWRAAVGRA